jgi:hypothetical protein
LVRECAARTNRVAWRYIHEWVAENLPPGAAWGELTEEIWAQRRQVRRQIRARLRASSRASDN